MMPLFLWNMDTAIRARCPWHSQLSSVRFDGDDLSDGFFYVAFAEQDAAADFMGLDFTAIYSGGEGNEGDFQQCGHLFAGEVAVGLFSSVGELQLLHLFADGFPYHFGEPLDGQAV